MTVDFEKANRLREQARAAEARGNDLRCRPTDRLILTTLAAVLRDLARREEMETP